MPIRVHADVSVSRRSSCIEPLIEPLGEGNRRIDLVGPNAGKNATDAPVHSGPIRTCGLYASAH
jgi:hypothetical protein